MNFTLLPNIIVHSSRYKRLTNLGVGRRRTEKRRALALGLSLAPRVGLGHELIYSLLDLLDLLGILMCRRELVLFIYRQYKRFISIRQSRFLVRQTEQSFRVTLGE